MGMFGKAVWLEQEGEFGEEQEIEGRSAVGGDGSFRFRVAMTSSCWKDAASFQQV